LKNHSFFEKNVAGKSPIRYREKVIVPGHRADAQVAEEPIRTSEGLIMAKKSKKSKTPKK
jgi:hypothetical protein